MPAASSADIIASNELFLTLNSPPSASAVCMVLRDRPAFFPSWEADHPSAPLALRIWEAVITFTKTSNLRKIRKFAIGSYGTQNGIHLAERIQAP